MAWRWTSSTALISSIPISAMILAACIPLHDQGLQHEPLWTSAAGATPMHWQPPRPVSRVARGSTKPCLRSARTLQCMRLLWQSSAKTLCVRPVSARSLAVSSLARGLGSHAPRIGLGDRRMRISDLCFWCSPDVVAAAELTRNGIRKIAMDLRTFSTTRVDVFQAAISRLSTDFLDDLRVCSLEAERHGMFKEDLVEQDARGRYFIPERYRIGLVKLAASLAGGFMHARRR